MKREKRVYENGYWPKVEYWTGLLNSALEQKDIDGALLCISKLEYFSGRQKDLETDLNTNIIAKKPTPPPPPPARLIKEGQIRDSEKIVAGCCIAFLVIIAIVAIQSFILGL